MSERLRPDIECYPNQDFEVPITLDRPLAPGEHLYGEWHGPVNSAERFKLTIRASLHEGGKGGNYILIGHIIGGVPGGLYENTIARVQNVEATKVRLLKPLRRLHVLAAAERPTDSE